MDGDPASKALDIRVSASLRHDLRTPLNHIIGYSEILVEEAENSACKELLPDLHRINQAARDMMDKLEALFRLAPDSGLDMSGETGFRTALSVPVHTPENGPEAIPSIDDEHGCPGKILVVDDNEANRDILSRRLQRKGYATGLAWSGQMALEKLALESYDLVLLDVMMPEMDGHETLARIKADRNLRHIPVIMISAQTELDSVVRCIEMGAEDYLPKPFNPVLLWARLGSSLEKQRLREQELEHREQTLRSEADLERLRALTQMVAGVAHEINTPLGIASTALSVIEGRLFAPTIRALFETSDASREVLADLADSSALLKGNILRAHKLVETFKKISVSQITENRERILLPELVTDTLDLFRINAKQSHLSIHVETSGLSGAPEWLGYPGYLSQIILNFLQNIERYAYPGGQGGPVEISLADRDESAGPAFVMVVRDHGAGISPEHLPKVFEPFFTTGRGRGGTGLGLSIVKNIVSTALKGQIAVTSELGQGTAFTLVFPKTIPA